MTINNQLNKEERKVYNSIKTIKLMNVAYASYGDERAEALQIGLNCMRKFIPEVAHSDVKKNRFICPACGYRIKLHKNEVAKFCGNCGQKLLYDGVDE